MARYFDEILQPNEKLLYSTSIHWIFYLPGLLAWIIAIAAFVLARRSESDAVHLFWIAVAVVAAVIATYWTFRAWFKRWTTETDVTDIRVVHKEGFIKRRTFEMNHDKVESVDVDQTILGRILGYGDVTIFGVGKGEETIKTIAHPLQFRNAITTR